MRRRQAACHRFHDSRGLSEGAAAGHVRADGIDLLIDSKGSTAGSRNGMLSDRPAPLQVQCLGYPGAMDNAPADYLIADRFVLPPEAGMPPKKCRWRHKLDSTLLLSAH